MTGVTLPASRPMTPQSRAGALRNFRRAPPWPAGARAEPIVRLTSRGSSGDSRWRCPPCPCADSTTGRSHGNRDTGCPRLASSQSLGAHPDEVGSSPEATESSGILRRQPWQPSLPARTSFRSPSGRIHAAPSPLAMSWESVLPILYYRDAAPVAGDAVAARALALSRPQPFALGNEVADASHISTTRNDDGSSERGVEDYDHVPRRENVSHRSNARARLGEAARPRFGDHRRRTYWITSSV